MASVLSQLPDNPVESSVTTAGSRKRSLPKITLGDLTPNNLGVLKRLNSVLFPVAYSDRFYKEVLDPALTPEAYSKLIFYQDLCVGNIVCRLQPSNAPPPSTISASVLPTSSAPVPSPAKSETYKLYVMTLGVLAPYRRQGLASKLVDHVISQAKASHHPVVEPQYKIKSSTDDAPADKKKKADKEKEKEKVVLVRPVITGFQLHVQVSNDEARMFWEGKGFKVVETIEKYYRKITPTDAWLMERDISGDQEE